MDLRKMMLCAFKENASSEDMEGLYEELTHHKEFFLVPAKKPIDKFPHLLKDGNLIVFLNEDDASAFAAVDDDSSRTVDLTTLKRADFGKMINELSARCAISGVKIYATPPISFVFTDLSALVADALLKKEESPMTVEEETMRIGSLLSFLDEKDRANMDANYKLYLANAHLLVKHFVQMFDIEVDQIGDQTGLDPDKIVHFCNDLGDSAVFTKAEFRKLLEYFNLNQYMYRFKDDCDEVSIFLNQHTVLNKYTLSFVAPEKIREVFTISNVTRGMVPQDGAFIYKVELKAKTRTIEAMITDPTGCKIGRPCEVLNLEKVIPDDPEKNESQKSGNLTDEKLNKARARADFGGRGGSGGQGRRGGKKKPTQKMDLGDDGDDDSI